MAQFTYVYGFWSVLRGGLKSASLCAFVLLCLLDVLLFRTDAYLAMVKPNSFAGNTIQRWRLVQNKKKINSNLVAFLGDSRVREGFSAKVFDQLADNTGLKAVNLSISGSTPRAWYYFLKRIDPDPGCSHFKSLIVCIPSYFDEDFGDAFSDSKYDEQVLLPVIRYSDSPEFVGSLTDPETKKDALLASFSRMYAYRKDLRDLLCSPGGRLGEISDADRYWERSDYLYDGRKESLKGIRISGNDLRGMPSFLNSEEKFRLHLSVFPYPVPDSFDHSEYMRKWLYRLAQRYSGTKTSVIFVCVPSNPLPIQAVRPHIQSTINMIAALPNVVIIPEKEFKSLNAPQYFADDVHLNSAGRAIFTKDISTKVIGILQSKNFATLSSAVQHNPE
jgi:hypothetical protein